MSFPIVLLLLTLGQLGAQAFAPISQVEIPIQENVDTSKGVPVPPPALCALDSTGKNVECKCNSKLLTLVNELKNIPAVDYGKLLIRDCSVSKIDQESFPTGMTFSSILVFSAQNLITFDVNFGDKLNTEVYIAAPTKLLPIFLPKLTGQNLKLKKIETALRGELQHIFKEEWIDAKSELEDISLVPSNYSLVLGNRAMIQDSLRFVTLNNIPVTSIYKDGLRTSGKNSVVISLRNSGLTDEKISALSSFTEDTPRAGTISLLLEKNSLTYLSERIFVPFLASHERNMIYMDSNALNCNAIHNNSWLWQLPSIDKDRILSAKCSDGRNFFSIQPYKTSCTYKQEKKTLTCDCSSRDDAFNLTEELLYNNQIDLVQLDEVDSLIIDSCVVSRIGADFDTLKNIAAIELRNLAKLEALDSLKSISNTLKSLSVTGANLLNFTDSLPIIAELKNLVSLTLTVKPDSNIEFSGGMLKNLTRLQHFRLMGGNRIETIREDAFSGLSSLISITLDDNEIVNPLEVNAFNLDTRFPKKKLRSDAANRIDISLVRCKLKNEMLALKPFPKLARNVQNAAIQVNLAENLITLVNSEAFDFLLINPNVGVNLRSNKLDCVDGAEADDKTKHPLWWLNTYSAKLRYQIDDAQCGEKNGVGLFKYVDYYFSTSLTTLPIEPVTTETPEDSPVTTTDKSTSGSGASNFNAIFSLLSLTIVASLLLH